MKNKKNETKLGVPKYASEPVRASADAIAKIQIKKTPVGELTDTITGLLDAALKDGHDVHYVRGTLVLY